MSLVLAVRNPVTGEVVVGADTCQSNSSTGKLHYIESQKIKAYPEDGFVIGAAGSASVANLLTSIEPLFPDPSILTKENPLDIHAWMKAINTTVIESAHRLFNEKDKTAGKDNIFQSCSFLIATKQHIIVIRKGAIVEYYDDIAFVGVSDGMTIIHAIQNLQSKLGHNYPFSVKETVEFGLDVASRVSAYVAPPFKFIAL